MVARRPRILPLLLVALVIAIALPGAGFVLFTVVKVLLVAWLVACLVGFVAMARFRRRMHRHWQSGGSGGFGQGGFGGGGFGRGGFAEGSQDGGRDGGQGGAGYHGGQWHRGQWHRYQWHGE